jgi:hypothetical protein
MSTSGLPDGLFSYQKCQFGFIFGRPCYGKLWCISLQFGILIAIYGDLEILLPFLYIFIYKIWQPRSVLNRMSPFDIAPKSPNSISPACQPAAGVK